MGNKKQVKINETLFEQLFSRKEIKGKVKELAQKIALDYPNPDNPLVLLVVLNGGMYFGVDLSRALEKIGRSNMIDTIRLKSYDSDENGGAIEVVNYPRLDLAGRDVIIIEDIVDRGDTLNFLNSHLLNLKEPPHSIKYCTLLMKRKHAPLKFNLEYLAWTVGSEWTIGDGMDTNQLARGLSGIYKKVS